MAVRFGGDDVVPQEISRLLGVEPDLAHRKGDPHRNLVWRHGLWSLSVPRSIPGDLEGQITSLFAKMTDDLSVWRELSKSYRGDIFCGLFLAESNEGISLSADCLRAIADRGLLIDFDIYGATRD